MPRTIETANLRLRTLRKGDKATFCGLYTDPGTMRFIAPPMTCEEARLCFEATLEATQLDAGPRFFVIVDKQGSGVIGLCSTQTVQPRARRVEAGMMLKAAACGRGIGSEVLAALIDTAFEALPIDTVWVQYRPANSAAKRLVAGLGFSLPNGVRPRAARRGHYIGFMQRSAWCVKPHPTLRGTTNVEHSRFS
jgi:RimJ/RimL family protein N-acetyltransferase